MAAKRFYHNQRYFPQKAQALAELAIFGTIILFLLGVLINYGLRYNYQQQVMQRAFRKAHQDAQRGGYGGNVSTYPKITTHISIRDIHVSDPSSTFGMGSITPMAASHAVVHSNKLSMAPLPDKNSDGTYNIADKSALPEIRIYFDTYDASSLHRIKTAGYRLEPITARNLPKYRFIYGDANITENGPAGYCLKWDEDCDTEITEPGYWKKNNEGREPDPGSGDPADCCLEYSQDYLIIDNCEGEVLDYSFCNSRCRMITDWGNCVKKCKEDPPDREDQCEGLCSSTIMTPWYCQNNFLDTIFQAQDGRPGRTLGLQQAQTQDFTTDNVLNKTESQSGVTATENVNWRTTTKRTIIYRPWGDRSGGVDYRDHESIISQNKTYNW